MVLRHDLSKRAVRGLTKRKSRQIFQLVALGAGAGCSRVKAAIERLHHHPLDSLLLQRLAKGEARLVFGRPDYRGSHRLQFTDGNGVKAAACQFAAYGNLHRAALL